MTTAQKWGAEVWGWVDLPRPSCLTMLRVKIGNMGKCKTKGKTTLLPHKFPPRGAPLLTTSTGGIPGIRIPPRAEPGQPRAAPGEAPAGAGRSPGTGCSPGRSPGEAHATKGLPARVTTANPSAHKGARTVHTTHAPHQPACFASCHSQVGMSDDEASDDAFGRAEGDFNYSDESDDNEEKEPPKKRLRKGNHSPILRLTNCFHQ